MQSECGLPLGWETVGDQTKSSSPCPTSSLLLFTVAWQPEDYLMSGCVCASLVTLRRFQQASLQRVRARMDGAAMADWRSHTARQHCYSCFSLLKPDNCGLDLNKFQNSLAVLEILLAMALLYICIHSLIQQELVFLQLFSDSKTEPAAAINPRLIPDFTGESQVHTDHTSQWKILQIRT